MKETVYHISAPAHYSIALLADTHNTDPAPILASLQVCRPDIVAIAGDILIGYRPESDNLIVESQENVLPWFLAAQLSLQLLSLSATTSG